MILQVLFAVTLVDPASLADLTTASAPVSTARLRARTARLRQRPTTTGMRVTVPLAPRQTTYPSSSVGLRRSTVIVYVALSPAPRRRAAGETETSESKPRAEEEK